MKWFKCAGIRALKTMAQTAVVSLTGLVTINDVQWWHVISACLMAGLLSLLTSLAGMPEHEKGKEDERNTSQPDYY